MAATSAINTPERTPGKIWQDIGVAAATTVFVGSLAALNASGNVIPASDTSGAKVVGRCEGVSSRATAVAEAATVIGGDGVNSGSAGDVKVNLKQGVFRFTNYASDLVTTAEIGKICYVYDDFTVRKGTGTNSIIAGRVTAVDSDGVWVDTSHKTAI